MKRSEIQVGERYAFGRRSWRDAQGFGTVAEVGVEYTTTSGRFGYYETKKSDGVRLVDVKWEAGMLEATTTVVPARDVNQLEASFRAEQAEEREVRREREAARQAVDRRQVAALGVLEELSGFEPGSVRSESEGRVSLTLEQLESIVEDLRALDRIREEGV